MGIRYSFKFVLHGPGHLSTIIRRRAKSDCKLFESHFSDYNGQLRPYSHLKEVYLKINALIDSMFTAKELDLPEEKLKSQTISRIILIYIFFLLMSLPVSVLLPHSSEHQLLISTGTVLWIMGSYLAFQLTKGKSYKVGASLFAVISSVSVLTALLIDQSAIVFISATPFLLIPLIVSFLYGEFKSSLCLAFFILCLIAVMPFITQEINLELIVAPFTFSALTSALLIVAHHQRNVEKKILVKERERSLHDMRLRSMGELTANIAHQMGTPLTVIEMAIENARENFMVGKTDQALAQLQITEDTIFKSKQFIDTLKNLYQPQKINHGTCTLAWIISQVRLFYGPRLAEQRVVLTGPSEYLHEDIPIPGEDLLQCILNLVDNGLHALKGQANASIKLSLKKNEQLLTLIYSDNGPGIQKVHATQIFDPFFTTKDQGEGTGLGLTITQAILRRHGAEISVMHGHLTGAAFKIDFKLPRLSN